MYDEPERQEDQTGPVGGETLSPGARLDEFELEGKLGARGFGVTYLAHDVSLGQLFFRSRGASPERSTG